MLLSEIHVLGNSFQLSGPTNLILIRLLYPSFK